MPTYDYKCERCEFEFEIFQRITAEPLKECPQCKGPVKRLISGGTGVIFKGSGFYTTDYKNTRTQTSAKPATKETNEKKESSTAKTKESTSKESTSNKN